MLGWLVGGVRVGGYLRWLGLRYGAGSLKVLIKIDVEWVCVVKRIVFWHHLYND